MLKTQFPRTYLAAVAHFMADQDVRYYLKGVYVEALSLEVRLVATDGNVLTAMRHLGENAESFDVIIPADTVALVSKMKLDFLDLERDDTGVWRLAGIAFVPVDGRFPDYRRVIPTGWTGEAAYFSAELFARFAKAGRTLKFKSNPILRQSGETGSGLVHFYGFDNFVGVLMPLRMFTEKMPDLGAPTWGPARYK
jgi:DNA polymerase-3 subunit beta